MTTRYDLFKMDDGSPVWFGAAETMEDVKARVWQAGVNSKYMVVDQLTGHKSVLTPEQMNLREQSPKHRVKTPSGFRHL